MFSTLLLLAATGAQAQTSCPASLSDIEEGVRVSYEQYREFNVDRFSKAVEEVAEVLACLDEPLTPRHAVRVHLLHALEAWVRRDTVQVLLSFRAIHALDPQFRLEEDIAPAGSRLLEAFRQASEGGGDRRVEIHGASLTIDGRPGQHEVPLDRAAIVQGRSLTGEPMSWYAWGAVTPDMAREMEGAGKLVAAQAPDPPEDTGTAEPSPAPAPAATPRSEPPRRFTLAGAPLTALTPKDMVQGARWYLSGELHGSLALSPHVALGLSAGNGWDEETSFYAIYLADLTWYHGRFEGLHAGLVGGFRYNVDRRPLLEWPVGAMVGYKHYFGRRISLDIEAGLTPGLFFDAYSDGMIHEWYIPARMMLGFTL